jgi:hypothetical protein
VSRGLALLAVLGAALLGGCGTGSDAPAPPPRPPEGVDKPAKLQRGWKTDINRVAGFTIGVPPLWTAAQNGTSTLLESPDTQVAISVSADRTDEALGIPLERFTLGAVESLSGFDGLKPGKAAEYAAHYPAVAVRAIGRRKGSGILQKLLLVIQRREGLAVYPALAATNAGKPSPFVQQIDPIIRSLRGRPVEATG